MSTDHNAQLAEIDHRTGYHPPKTSDTIALHEEVRARTNALMRFVVEQLPDNMPREKALALTKLDEAMFFMNAAVARGHALQSGDGGTA